jgi:hypothetical protein
MDRQVVGAALMWDVNQCPVCTCPHSELDRTEVSYSYRNTGPVKAAVKAVQEEHHDENVKFGYNDSEEVRNNILIYRFFVV